MYQTIIDNFQKVSTAKSLLKDNNIHALKEFIIQNNLSLNMINENGNTLNDILYEGFFQNILRYGSPVIKGEQVQEFEDVMIYLLDKNPEFWFYDKFDGRQQSKIWFASFLLFDNQEKIKEIMNHFPAFTEINCSQYIVERNISLDMIKILYEHNKNKLEVFDVFYLAYTYKKSSQDVFNFFSSKNIKFDYEHFLHHFRFLFSDLIVKDEQEFTALFSQSIEFFYNKLQSKKLEDSKIIKVMREIFSSMLFENKDKKSLDKDYVVPALHVLKRYFPQIPHEAYLNTDGRFSSALYSLGFLGEINADYKIKLSNGALISQQSLASCENYTAFLMSHHITNSKEDQKEAMKNIKPVYDYFNDFPDKVIEDLNKIKMACEKLNIEFKSTNDAINTFIRYAYLESELKNSNNQNGKKQKI